MRKPKLTSEGYEDSKCPKCGNGHMWTRRFDTGPLNRLCPVCKYFLRENP